MEVTRYIFQSPYSSQVQIGRPDGGGGGQKNTQDDSALIKSTNKVLSDATNFKAAQTQEVEATVQPAPVLDTYA